MQSRNRKANVLQSMLGVFFQSAHTPQKVIKTLARIGISISPESINAAVRSLSIESANNLRTLGQSLLAAYAYDNFDVNLKSHVPTAEKTNDSLKHLTSGLLFPLVHGTVPDDLKCAEELWKRSPLNPSSDESLQTKKTWRNLLTMKSSSCFVVALHALKCHPLFPEASILSSFRYVSCTISLACLVSDVLFPDG